MFNFKDDCTDGSDELFCGNLAYSNYSSAAIK